MVSKWYKFLNYNHIMQVSFNTQNPTLHTNPANQMTGVMLQIKESPTLRKMKQHSKSV